MESGDIFVLKHSHIKAELLVSGDKFIVKKDSMCAYQHTHCMAEGWVKLKRECMSNGTLIATGDYYAFTRDTVFSSLSAAASVILGKQAAGPKYWVKRNQN
jgi:hypothetical protein